MEILTFSLPAIPPFRLDLTVWALKRRERNIIDNWDGSQYVRILIVEDIPVKVQIIQNLEESRILVTVKSENPLSHLKTNLSATLNSLLGLQINLREFYEITKNDKILHPLIKKFQGLKPPRFPSLFESLANSIACQQLSLEAGLSILNKFVQKFGVPFKENQHIHYAFPKPKDIINCECEELMQLGFSRHKSETIIRLASEIVNHKNAFLETERTTNDKIIKFLTSFKGIGRWSAEYVLLRGLGRTEIIPCDDIAVQKHIKEIFHLQQKPDYHEMKDFEKKWFPYAGMIYFHFLLQQLSDSNINI